QLTGVSHEKMTWKSTGTVLQPFSPNETDMHGESPDMVLVDELWSFDADQRSLVQQAYQPGFVTKNGQAWLISAAGTASSAWLNDARESGRAAVEAGETEGMAYFESSIPEQVDGIPVEKLDDESILDLVMRWHPARGHTLRERAVRDALRDLGRLEFLRAYGNHPGETTTAALVAPAVFRRAMAGDVIPDGVRVGYGIEADPDGRWAAIVAGWRDPDTGVARTQTI